jgi:phage terminase large subunit-like protein
VPQRVKSLEDRIAARTFEARRLPHRFLLESEPLAVDPDLRRLQLRYKRTKSPAKRIDLAREFERTVNGAADEREERVAADLQVELAKLGPPRSAKRANAFFPRFLKLEDGRPFRLEQWERDVNGELFRRRKDGSRLYKQFVVGISRGNGKTPWATGLGTLNTLEDENARVFQAAGSKDQARVGTEFAGAWIEDGELAQWLTAKATAIERRDSRGYYRIQSADGRMAHGKKPTWPMLDEWWLMESARERQVYIAFVSSLHKEAESCLVATSTAGYDKTSQLGEFYEQALRGEVEYRREGFLRIARDADAGSCLWWYGMPEGYELDLENDKAVLRALKLANPSKFVDVETLLRLLRAPGCDVYEWIRLHLNAWTTTRDSWLPLGCIGGMRVNEPIPAGADVWVAVDAALTHDTTAVVWAARVDGKIRMQGRAWAAREGAPAHELHAGGRIRNREVMEWIDRELGGRYNVREIVADSRFFDDYIWELGQRGYLVAVFAQNSAEMRDAEQHFFQRATAGELEWYDPAGIFAAHLEATSARPTRSGWKVENPDKSRPIDLATSGIMASERVALAERQSVSVYEKRGLDVFEGPTRKPVGDQAAEEEQQTSESIPYSTELAQLLGLNVGDDEDPDLDLDDDDEDDDL